MARLRHGAAVEGGSEVAPTAPVQSAFVDVGEGNGALVLSAGAERVGLEVEIEPVDGAPRTHVMVLERETPESDRFAALFPSLRPGRYRVIGLDGGAAGEVEVRPGAIANGVWG